MRSRPLRVAAVSVIGLVAAVSACGDDDSSGSSSESITVFAASSLTTSFTEIADTFTEDTGVAVELVFAGSSDLVAQIGEGAPADVFASADESTMQRLVDAGLNGADPVLVASNTMAIAVEPGNPLGIDEVDDLAADGTLVVLCAPEVPCGEAAAAVIDNAGADVAPVSLEDKVTAVVTKVASGEADAGIVFVTDVSAADGDVDGVAIPADINAISKYPMVVTEDAPDAAQDFVDFVAGERGQEILAAFGFAPA